MRGKLHSLNNITMKLLEIKNLQTEISGKIILKGINLKIGKGELHILMGPNGSGKSTLAQVLAGNPAYRASKGAIRFQNKNFLKLKPEARAKAGLFLQFQNPPELSGISLGTLVRRSRQILGVKNRYSNLVEAGAEIINKAKSFRLSKQFLEREMNGFSGGEKKRAEILQLALIPWKLAVLDEPDSGLDADGVRMAAKEINKLISNGRSVLLITHTQRIAEYLKPTRAHILIDGKIAKSGGKELVKKIEEKGYEWLNKS